MSDSIVDALDPAAIRLQLESKKKPGLIRELVDLLAEAGRIEDAELVAAAVLEREALAGTGIGGGIAIPHCLTSAVTDTVMAFGRRIPGAKFDAVDRKPVELFFLMVGPPDSHSRHLRLLSKLSRYLHDGDFKAGLLTAQTPARVLELFAAKEAG